MNFTYRKVANPDGSTTISAPPVIRPLWHGFWHGVPAWIAVLVLLGSLAAMIDGQWGAAAVSLLVGAIFLPARTKWRRLRPR